MDPVAPRLRTELRSRRGAWARRRRHGARARRRRPGGRRGGAEQFFQKGGGFLIGQPSRFVHFEHLLNVFSHDCDGLGSAAGDRFCWICSIATANEISPPCRALKDFPDGAILCTAASSGAGAPGPASFFQLRQPGADCRITESQCRLHLANATFAADKDAQKMEILLGKRGELVQSKRARNPDATCLRQPSSTGRSVSWQFGHWRFESIWCIFDENNRIFKNSNSIFN